MYRAVYGGDNHTDVALTLGNLARDLARTGAFDEAETTFREARKVWRALGGTNDPNYSTQLAKLGVVLVTRGDYSEADLLLREAFWHETNRLSIRFLDAAQTARTIAICRKNQGDRTNMVNWLIQSKVALDAVSVPWVNRVVETEELAEDLSLLFWDAGELLLAEDLQRKTVDSKSKRFPPDSIDRCHSEAILGGMLAERAWQERAKRSTEQALRYSREAEQLTWELLGRLEGATNTSTELVALVRGHLGWALLAVALLEPSYEQIDRERLFSASQACLCASYETYVRLPATQQGGVRTTLTRLVWLYDLWGKAGSYPAAGPLNALWNAQLAAFDRRTAAAASQTIVSNPGASKDAADQ